MDLVEIRILKQRKDFVFAFVFRLLSEKHNNELIWKRDLVSWP